uniref:Uncharacterized protein n=1 Tax=Siphoviridae sp. ctuUw41 TaxID=2826503 RepID=A0A8S5MZE3_9CAUD|nr:MAG TPA: hypothetical protein [Siphoviridae sp. ctuUw41]
MYLLLIVNCSLSSKNSIQKLRRKVKEWRFSLSGREGKWNN